MFVREVYLPLSNEDREWNLRMIKTNFREMVNPLMLEMERRLQLAFGRDSVIHPTRKGGDG
jgi:hypothetical protein